MRQSNRCADEREQEVMKMRKWMALLWALTVMLCTGFALAEGIDLAELSDDALVALMNRIQEEIVARHIEGTATLPGGAYIAGKDIPTGAYIFTCLATGDDWGNVTIYSDEGEGKQLFWEVVMAPDEGEAPESFFITLREGDQLKSSVAFSLTVYVGVIFK